MAAKLSLLAPLLMIAITLILGMVGRVSSSDLLSKVVLAMGGLFVWVIIVGVICALSALCTVKSEIAARVMVMGTLGIILNAALACLVFTNAVKSAGQFGGLRAVNQKLEAMRVEARRALDRGEDAGFSSTNIAELRDILDKASENTSGKEALLARVTSELFSKVQAATAEYENAAQALEAAGVLNLERITTRAHLQARRSAIDAFLAANEKFTAFVRNTEYIFAEELAKVDLTQRDRDSALRGFRLRFKPSLALQLRQTDLVLGKELLEIVDLLEANWGEWRLEKAADGPTFETEALAVKFNQHLGNIHVAAAEQADLKRQLLNAPL